MSCGAGSRSLLVATLLCLASLAACDVDMRVILTRSLHQLAKDAGTAIDESKLSRGFCFSATEGMPESGCQNQPHQGSINIGLFLRAFAQKIPHSFENSWGVTFGNPSKAQPFSSVAERNVPDSVAIDSFHSSGSHDYRRRLLSVTGDRR